MQLNIVLVLGLPLLAQLVNAMPHHRHDHLDVLKEIISHQQEEYDDRPIRARRSHASAHHDSACSNHGHIPGFKAHCECVKPFRGTDCQEFESRKCRTDSDCPHHSIFPVVCQSIPQRNWGVCLPKVFLTP